MIQNLFVNLPVQDLARAKAFFTALGFSFNPQFEDENACSLVLSENQVVMLLTTSFFKTFTKKQITDTTISNEVHLAIQLESREEVDALMEKAVANGGTIAHEPQDEGFMYSCAFYDLDGHAWAPFWMDTSAMPTPEE